MYIYIYVANGWSSYPQLIMILEEIWTYNSWWRFSVWYILYILLCMTSSNKVDSQTFQNDFINFVCMFVCFKFPLKFERCGCLVEMFDAKLVCTMYIICWWLEDVLISLFFFSNYFSGDKSEVLDIDNPDLIKYPLFVRATPYECILNKRRCTIHTW